MDEAMLHMIELITALKKGGLSEPSAVRFAAIYFNEMSQNGQDEDD
ncbi:hypothetical protein Srufu_079770 (plasmid) [Streptomyces libani subsp. rufus]|nr:hypothetical protein Srufu_079770 [Streptomyces libani subsp. rufus]